MVDFSQRAQGRLFQEDLLQKNGYYPFISTVTGFCRVVKHVSTLFTDIIFSVESSILSCAKQEVPAEFGCLGPGGSLTRHSVSMPILLGKSIIHNISNIARGIIEMVPLVGNGVCWVFDKIFGYDHAGQERALKKQLEEIDFWNVRRNNSTKNQFGKIG